MAVGIPEVPLSWRWLWGNGVRSIKGRKSCKTLGNQWKITGKSVDLLIFCSDGDKSVETGNWNRNDWFQDLATVQVWRSFCSKQNWKKTRLLFRQSLTRRYSAENLTWKPSKSASLIIPYQALQQDNSANEWPNHGFRLDLRMDLFQAKKITNRRLKQYKSNELTIKHPVKSLLNHHVIIHSSNNPNK